MKKEIFKGFVIGCAVMAMSFLTMSCGNKDDIFPNVMKQDYIFNNIQAYHLKNVEGKAAENREMNVYIDFSDGLWQAYKNNPDNGVMIQAIAQNLTGGAVKWYGVGSNKIYDLDFPNTELYNKVVNPKSYSKEIMAPIQETVNKIVEANEDALFVTDFEEYTQDKKEQFLGFAKDYFIEWLKKGNSIDFYVTDYTEKCKKNRTVGKHLYFIIFSTPGHPLKDKIDFALKGRTCRYETFNLSKNFFSLSNEYPAANKGGNYYNEKGEDIVFLLDENYFKNNFKDNFEFYPCQSTWADIYSNSKSLMEQGVPKQFTHVLRNLFINLKNDDIFTINGLGVKVYDVTDDYTFFVQANEAKKHAPKLTKDASGNVIIDESETNPIAVTCYDDKGNLKKEWNYSPKKIMELPEVFTLDKQLFNNTKASNPEKTEIGIMYHPNFTGSLSNPGALIRVDVVVDNCEPNFEKLSRLFSWDSSTQKDKKNSSLEESIRNTLEKINPQGETIYSYYIVTVDEK